MSLLQVVADAGGGPVLVQVLNGAAGRIADHGCTSRDLGENLQVFTREQIWRTADIGSEKGVRVWSSDLVRRCSDE